MTEKLTLKWNDFQGNISTAFRSLRNDTNFSDVTLACEDGEQVEAHKVILTASSPFFQSLLARNKHPHPLIYMRGVKSEDLVALVDFLYFGEAEVFEDKVHSFLALAGELKLNGLTENDETEELVNSKSRSARHNFETSESFVNSLTENIGTERFTKPKNKTTPTRKYKTKNIEPNLTGEFTTKVESNTIIANAENPYVEEFQALDQQIKSMMSKSTSWLSNGKVQKRASLCKVCGKEDSYRNIKDHVEINHITGLSAPCSLCGKTFRNRISLRKHNGVIPGIPGKCRNLFFLSQFFIFYDRQKTKKYPTSVHTLK